MNASTIAPLPDAVVEALAGLPNGPELPAHRAHLLEHHPRFAECLRRVERRGLPARSLAELWLWLVHLTLDRGSRPATTGHSYARTAARFLQWADGNGIDFTAVTTEDLNRWQRWLAVECNNGPTWRAQQVHAMRNFFDWRRACGLAKANAAIDLKGPRIKPKPARKYTDDQLRSLFRAIASAHPLRAVRDRCATLLLLTTGLRREELSSLKLQHLEISAQRGVVRIEGKGAKEREVPFEGPVVAALHEWLAARDALPYDIDRDAVFVSLTGPTQGRQLALRSFEGMMAHHAKAAQLRDWGIHRFRVTFATQLYDDGADLETIRALMGHESIETTRGYLAVSERARRTRLSSARQHRVLGTKPTGTPMWARLAAGELTSD